jgi:hypothetical protein
MAIGCPNQIILDVILATAPLRMPRSLLLPKAGLKTKALLSKVTVGT